jgi:Na+-translocating ferredoxin:NAD+ oxidoreductase subunit B
MLSVPFTVTVAAIDALLPQTQCQRCSYADCHAYAEAIGSGAAEINRCPPGGEATRHALATLLARSGECLTLADDVDAYAPEHVAVIDEAACIGCAACLPVCPTDAIIGASKRMHTVIAADCTGCELCIIACPVVTTLKHSYDAHKLRFLQRAEAKAEVHAPKVMPDKKALLAAILAKAKARA